MTFSPRSVMAAAREVLPKDARVFQILFLALLLTTGVLLRDFSLHPLQMALAFAAGLATQAFWLKRLAPAVWLLMLGTIVTTRARRLDISWMFLGAFLGLVALRVMLLGQSWAIWWHQLGNGALLLFAFFMISDPMTIPNRRGPRIAYAVIVAAAAIAWQYLLFRPNALIWALFLATPLVPLLDRLFPGESFSWRGRDSAAGHDPTPVHA